MANYLDTLAMEAEVLAADETPYEVDETVGDLIEASQAPVQPVDMLDHAEKAREIADQLDELADKAEELADEDQQYSSASLESLTREYGIVTRMFDLTYAPQSFESEFRPAPRAKQLAVDARRAAEHLRNNRGRLDELSAEGLSFNQHASSLRDMFVDKDKAIAKAHVVLQRELGALKGIAAALNNEGVVLTHEGVARFLTAAGEETRDLTASIKHEAEYLAGVKKYIDDRLHAVSAVEPGKGLQKGNVALVNTSTKGLVKGAYLIADVKDFSLMGNVGVFDFHLVERPGLSAKMGVGDAVKHLAGSYLKSVILIGAGVAVAGLPGMVAGTVAASAAVQDSSLKTRQKTLDKSEISTRITVNQLTSAVNTVLGLEHYAKTDATYTQIAELEGKLKELKSQDKALYSAAMDELNLVKKALTILKDRTFYLTTQLARLLEQVVRKSK